MFKEIHPPIEPSDMERAVAEIMENVEKMYAASYKARNEKTINGIRGTLFYIRKLS